MTTAAQPHCLSVSTRAPYSPLPITLHLALPYILNGRVRFSPPSSPDSPSEAPDSCHLCLLAAYLPFGWYLENCPSVAFTHHAASVFHPHVWSQWRCVSATTLANHLRRDSYPEIVAPVPRRHQALQPSPDAWIYTPSPPSSRAISPTTPIRGEVSRTSGHYRDSYASFSSVMEAGPGKEAPLQEEQGFGRRWLRWMYKNGVKHWVVPCTLLASVLVRWCIGLGSYSGTLAKNNNTTIDEVMTSSRDSMI
jgi:hypothetical protein